MDWTTPLNDVAEGGGILTFTRNANNTRSGIRYVVFLDPMLSQLRDIFKPIRDHLVATQKKTPKALTFALETLVTKILTCRTTDGKVKAYGVSAVKGAALPVSPKFKAKYTTTPVNYFAKNEVSS